MKKIVLILVSLVVVGCFVLIGVNIKPDGQSVGTVVGNAIDGAIDDVVNTYNGAERALKTEASSLTGTIGNWLADLGSSLQGTSDDLAEQAHY